MGIVVGGFEERRRAKALRRMVHLASSSHSDYRIITPDGSRILCQGDDLAEMRRNLFMLTENEVGLGRQAPGLYQVTVTVSPVPDDDGPQYA